MRFIEKGGEPVEFTEWKAEVKGTDDENYKALKRPVRPKVIESLLSEQGYICGYCEIGLNVGVTAIDHMIPQCKLELHGISDLDYSNFIGCCLGGSADERPRTLHCDKAKDDWYDPELFISPLDPNCASAFFYKDNGEIVTAPGFERQEAARMTIDKLGLNIQKIIDSRRSAIDTLIPDLLDMNTDEIQKEIKKFDQKDSEGRYTRHCSAVLCLLTTFYNSKSRKT